MIVPSLLLLFFSSFSSSFFLGGGGGGGVWSQENKFHMAVLNVLDRVFSLPDKSALLFAVVGLQGSDPMSAAHCLLSFLQTSSRQLLSFLGTWQAGVQQPAEIITQQTDL